MGLNHRKTSELKLREIGRPKIANWSRTGIGKSKLHPESAGIAPYR
jgi:hypothetical protein